VDCDVRASRPTIFDPLSNKVQYIHDASSEWRKEKVSYVAAYGDERVPAFLYLPKSAEPPYQVATGMLI